MSQFSQALQSLILTRGTAVRLAEQTGISASVLSRLARGTSATPSPETLACLCSGCSQDEIYALLNAWIADSMPPVLRKHICISGQPVQHPDPGTDYAATISRLSPTMRQALTDLANLCLESDEIARLVLLHTRHASAKPPKPCSKPSAPDSETL